MGLANLVIPERTVTIMGGQEVTLHALDMEGIIVLMQEDLAAFRAIYEMPELSLNQLIKMAPRLCHKLIAHGCGEPAEWEKASKIPLGDQLVLIEGIWELTNLDMDTLGKVMGYLADMMEAAPDGLLTKTQEAHSEVPPMTSSVD